MIQFFHQSEFIFLIHFFPQSFWSTVMQVYFDSFKYTFKDCEGLYIHKIYTKSLWMNVCFFCLLFFCVSIFSWKNIFNFVIRKTFEMEKHNRIFESHRNRWWVCCSSLWNAVKTLDVRGSSCHKGHLWFLRSGLYRLLPFTFIEHLVSLTITRWLRCTYRKIGFDWTQGFVPWEKSLSA